MGSDSSFLVSAHAAEVERGDRFSFGTNWQRFLQHVTDDRIREAERSLCEMLGVTDLRGVRFLDIGCGSGLFSLAARRLGATVHSFDYDPVSAACAMELRRRYFGVDENWTIEEGSVLDQRYLSSVGRYDVVYSWGVLHHTGSMWRAIALAAEKVAANGRLFIAIYNDQGSWSARWKRIKRFYCSGPLARVLVICTYVPIMMLRNLAADVLWGRNPMSQYREYRRNRGMSIVHDWIDWLGGYPFEVAKPEQVLDFLRSDGFQLEKLKTCGGSCGCNEYIFRRPSKGGADADSQSHARETNSDLAGVC